jgi:hypothetical protein
VSAEGGKLTLNFIAMAGEELGTFFNNVAGTSTNAIVVPTGDSAPVTVAQLEVDIDIWPFLKRNIVFLGRDHPVPVAVLSTNDLDALGEVAEGSLTFGRTGEEESLKRCLNHGVDVNKDGLEDLVCVFWSGPAGFQEGDTEATLRGKTIEGAPFEGRDGVVVMPARATRLFQAYLSGDNEDPAVKASGKGYATLTLNRALTKLDFSVSLWGIKNVTGIEIHCAPEGQTGPVGVTLYDGARATRSFFRGSITGADAGNSCGWDSLDAILMAMRSGDTYINVYTTQHPDGEVRGQIEPIGMNWD